MPRILKKKTIVEKACSKCGEIKSMSEFYVDKKATRIGRMAECKVCLDARNKEYTRAHKEQMDEWKKRYYILHKEKIREYGREYRKSHPEKFRASTRKYTHKKRASGGGVTKEEWEELKKRYDYMCLRCERKDVELTQDHVVPVSKGGVNLIGNIQPLCHSCNSIKRTNTTDYRPKFDQNINVNLILYRYICV